MGTFDADLMLVIGLALGVLAIPSLFSAWVDGRVPRGASIVVLISGTLIVLATTRKPGGYDFETLPDVVVRVIGALF